MHAHNRSNSRRQEKKENSTSKEEIQIEPIRLESRRKACREEMKGKRKLIKEKLKSGTPRKTIEKRNRH
jgi:hypothetical protein